MELFLLSGKDSLGVLFVRGSIYGFIFIIDKFFGFLIELVFIYDNLGKSFFWFLEDVIIRDR